MRVAITCHRLGIGNPMSRTFAPAQPTQTPGPPGSLPFRPINGNTPKPGLLLVPHSSSHVPAGTWHPENSRSRRRRSRSPKRSCESDLLESIKHKGAEDFKGLFSLPEEFRAVAYLPPSDVVVDIHSIKDKEARMATCRRLNDLRRERLIPLASPSAKAFYQEDGFKCFPMSRITERPFWDLFHRLPIATKDASKWKAVNPKLPLPQKKVE